MDTVGLPSLEILVSEPDGFAIWNEPPFANGQPGIRLHKVQCSSVKFSEDGSKLMVMKSESQITIYDCKSWQEMRSFSVTNVLAASVSPSGTYLQTFQKSTSAQDKNVVLWKTDTGDSVHQLWQKNISKATWPSIRFSSDESIASRFLTNEVQFFDPTDFSKGVVHRIRVPGVAALELSTSGNHVAVFVPESKGMPASVQIFSTGKDLQSPVARRSFFRCSTVQMNWNCGSTGLLVLVQSDIDKTNQSYYGESKVYYLTTDGTHEGHVPLRKEGPVHDVQWSRSGNEFAVVYGFMPAMATVFDKKCNVILELGTGPYNTIRWNPKGKFICLAGFGNLPGDMVFWDYVEKRLLGTSKAEWSVTFEWSPDGQYFMTATTAPRRQVDNGINIFHHNGSLYFKRMFDKLFQADWKPESPDKFRGIAEVVKSVDNLKIQDVKSQGQGSKPSQLSSKPIPAIPPSQKPAAYRPPHAKSAAAVQAEVLGQIIPRQRPTASYRKRKAGRSSQQQLDEPSHSRDDADIGGPDNEMDFILPEPTPEMEYLIGDDDDYHIGSGMEHHSDRFIEELGGDDDDGDGDGDGGYVDDDGDDDGGRGSGSGVGGEHSGAGGEHSGDGGEKEQVITHRRRAGDGRFTAKDKNKRPTVELDPWEVTVPCVGGPVDGSVIPSWLGHVASRYGQAGERLRPHFRCQNRKGVCGKLRRWFAEMPADWRDRLSVTRLSHLPATMFPSIDAPLICAFIERWQPDTNTFHLPFGEMGILLHDVWEILRIPVEGRMVNDVTHQDVVKALCREVVELDERSLDWRKMYDSGCLVTERVFDRRWNNGDERDLVLDVEAWLLVTIGACLFPDKSANKFRPQSVVQIRNKLGEVGQYSWGSATLAFLYRQLGVASRGGTSSMAGCLTLLQSWIYEYFPIFRPHAVPSIIDRHAPRARLWRVSTGSDRDMRLATYREQLDSMTADEVTWLPYGDFPHVHTEITIYRGVLAAHGTVEPYMPDRCVRQLGYVQGVPRPILRPISCMRRYDGTGYKVEFSRDMFYMWDSFPDGSSIRTDRLLHSASNPGACTEDYMDWYARHSHSRIFVGLSLHDARRVPSRGNTEYWMRESLSVSRRFCEIIRYRGCDEADECEEQLASLVDRWHLAQ